MSYNSRPRFIGISLILGLSLLGFFIFKGLKTFSDKDRVVKVKGLAEMNITAISAQTYLSFSFSGDNLQKIIRDTETKKLRIINYLKETGFEDKNINIGSPEISDKEKYYEDQWINGKTVSVKIKRYSSGLSLTIQSEDVKTVEQKAKQLKFDLIKKGLTSSIYTDYIFPELNSVKPKLIAESTKNARIAGEQFANDSEATLGKIKTASQVQISIAGSYDSPDPYIQKARVVSTIVFFLD
ncbi:SIMPL domain-containing protein [Flavobacteriaceae bacterium]|nr:SIMPL domain-containing protein [Flavobacteriaceae bacterium]MDA7848737.1 SIMPL domain-containing protein [Flavobacteriaceae bacterium]